MPYGHDQLPVFQPGDRQQTALILRQVVVPGLVEADLRLCPAQGQRDGGRRAHQLQLKGISGALRQSAVGIPFALCMLIVHNRMAAA